MDHFRGTPKFGVVDNDVTMNVDIAAGHTVDIFGDTMVGRVGATGAVGSSYADDYLYDVGNIVLSSEKNSYKYAEDRIIADFKAYIDKTYSEHYKTEQQNIECFDAWIALDDATPTFRNTALKYLWLIS